MTSVLSWQQNDVVTNFTYKNISRHWELFFQNRSSEQFPPIAAAMKFFWLDMSLINPPSENAKIPQTNSKTYSNALKKGKGKTAKSEYSRT